MSNKPQPNHLSSPSKSPSNSRKSPEGSRGNCSPNKGGPPETTDRCQWPQDIGGYVKKGGW